MNPTDYQAQASRTECNNERARQRLIETSYQPTNYMPIRIAHAIMGMVNEVGELSSLVKGHIYHGRHLDKVWIAEEVGDLLWYIALICNALELDMGNIMTANIAKLKARYPDKYSDEDANDRDKDAERDTIRHYCPNQE